MNFLARLKPDPFTTSLIGTVALASVLPCRGIAARGVGDAVDIAIGLLFFLHGARLSRGALISGLTNWRLHAAAFATSFVIFPLVGLGRIDIHRIQIMALAK